MKDPFEVISTVGVLPVIKIEDKNTAVNLATAIRDGGINAIEVTARNETAFESIALIKNAFPDMMVGAGTITNIEMVKTALNAGADFIVSPGFSIEMVKFCVDNNIPVNPGCVTPSEILEAQELGLRVVKFFPANRYGGVGGIKDLSGPFSKMRFIPTCGINFDNLGEYLSCPAVAAVGGSFMAKADVIASHDWDTITSNCRKAVEIALGFELAHVGINCPNKEEAVQWANYINTAFPFGVNIGGKSTFLGTAVEFMHTPYFGTHGHIGFKVNSCERAKVFFESQGLAVNEDSISFDSKGNIKFFYLMDEIGGFALHVIKK